MYEFFCITGMTVWIALGIMFFGYIILKSLENMVTARNKRNYDEWLEKRKNDPKLQAMIQDQKRLIETYLKEIGKN